MENKKRNSIESETPNNAYFLSLELENIRCFSERQTIDFSDDKDNWKRWTIILGDNGTGKTTILKSLIALTPVKVENEISVLTPPIDLHNPNPKKEVERFINSKIAIDSEFRKSLNLSRKPITQLNLHQKRGAIYFSKFGYRLRTIFTLNQNKNKKKKLQTALDFIHFDGSGNTSVKNPHLELENLKCFAYGAARKAGNTSFSDEEESSKYQTLFDESVLLLNPEEWLLRINYARFFYEAEEKRDMLSSIENRKYRGRKSQELEIVINTLIDILPDVDDIRFNEKELQNRKNPQPIVEFHTPYGWVEAKDLSLGYRTSMAWMVDFAARMFDLYPESENPLAEPAVVLIDEIDLHLHPKWQRDLLDWLSDLCPNTQFIVTTHSPLIVQAGIARDANFAVCRREGDHVVIDQSIEAVKGWRADQILASDFFDIPKRDNQTEKDLERRKELIIKSKLTKAEQKELAELNKKVESLPVSENLEDDKAMEIIRKAANYIKENGATVK
jgi:predicted ATP-binding protein involved in virulence